MASRFASRTSTATALLGLALSVAACQSSTIVFDDRSIVPQVGGPGMRGDRVIGRDCRWRFLTLGSPELSPSLHAALQRTLDRNPDAMSLVDVVVRRDTTVTYVVDASCYVVEATALRPEHAAGLSLEGEGETGAPEPSWQDTVFDVWDDLTSWSF